MRPQPQAGGALRAGGRGTGATRWRTAEGIQRKGVVLAMLMRLKQICNHPSQWLGDGALGRGGQRQVGASARDRRGGRGAPGEDAGLHPVPRDDRAAGRVPRRGVRAAGAGAARRDRGQEAGETWCSTFQEDENVPFFVLSLKAGGTGLNSDRRLARGALRPLVEPGGREPGDRSRLPHRPEAQRAGAQVRLPRYGRGEDRRA